MNRGFNGHPKSSKSIPGSGITVETGTDEIRYLVVSDNTRDPALSPVFQPMYQMTYPSHDELLLLHQACVEGSQRWDTEKRRFFEFLVYVKELWP